MLAQFMASKPAGSLLQAFVHLAGTRKTQTLGVCKYADRYVEKKQEMAPAA